MVMELAASEKSMKNQTYIKKLYKHKGLNQTETLKKSETLWQVEFNFY